MRLPRRLPLSALRRFVTVAALLAQAFAATGAPVFSRPGVNKPGAIPFPCQNHPCGCATSEQGWAGDCCCFTLEEKLAWADARGVVPPEHVRPTVAARKITQKSEPSCCSKKAHSCCEAAEPAGESCPPETAQVAKPSVRWVAGVFAQKCRGEGFAGLLKLELISIPHLTSGTRGSADPIDSVHEPASRYTPTSGSPPTPPPRIS